MARETITGSKYADGKYILFMNPDVLIEDNNAIQELYES